MFLKHLAAALAATCSLAHASSTFSFTGGAQVFVAPATGIYQITAFGAQGGGGSSASGGKGAEITALFALTVGQTLDIFVGQQGSSGGFWTGGGGGGTFVMFSGTPLLIAGGGGGAGVGSGPYAPGIAGQITISGTDGSGLNGVGVGGTAGSGGTGASAFSGGGGYNGGGGAGLLGDGTSGANGGSGSGGFDLANGLGGGSGTSSGGYGGGGASGGNGGGGGGGYSGGGSGSGYDNTIVNGGGGGGGSFVALSGTVLFQMAGAQSGNGQVTIDLVPAPEPESLGLVTAGLILLATGWRKHAASKSPNA